MGISPISIDEEMAKDIRDKSDVVCNFYQLFEDVPSPKELSPEEKNLMIFDELLLEKQNTCESYYVTGRLFSSKLPQATASNYQRKREFHMSVSSRSEEP